MNWHWHRGGRIDWARSLPQLPGETTKAWISRCSALRQRLRPSPPDLRTRPCMTCRRPFGSEGHHNRMCDPCRGLNWSPYAPDDLPPDLGAMMTHSAVVPQRGDTVR